MRVAAANTGIARTSLLLCGLVLLLSPACGRSSASEKGHGHKEHGEEGEHRGEGREGHGESGHGAHEGEDGVSLSAVQLKEFKIEVSTASAGVLPVRLDLTGEVRLDPSRVSHLVPSISGVARKVYKQLGDTVKEGELMATLASRELAQLNAAYLAAQANGSLAWIEYKREKKLYERGVSSQREFQRARLAMSRASVAVQMARRKLLALGFAKRDILAMARRPAARMSRFDLRAPFAGVVVSKHISQGEYLKADSQAFTVADLSKVWVVLKVYQKDLPLVRVKQQVEIRAAYGRLKASGKIAYVSPIVDPSTRTASARVVLRNPKGRWQPGLFVNGEVVIHELKVGVLVERTALLRQADSQCIFVKRGKGFICKKVELGKGNATHVAVLRGLRPGERYVSKGGFTLKAQQSKSSFGGGHSH